ncbi:hypothetical protein [uncultured Bifidobacterium sp.]|uniref:hypothetical protein n=1 Tax=uncultured Bifidobacterium sp. TaxID=165187 RepID=UPI00258E8C5B|nr:hypothetical protein [uncultured Bifidobacterium sp.]
MTTALGVQPDSNGNGVTPEVHRQIIAAQWQNTGVIDGLGVTGRSDLRYNVAAGVAVCSKGAADGKTLAYWPGGQTAAVAAGDASNPRVDAIWITAHNPKIGDADNQVVVGVTQGTPAANPVAPPIPAGCTPIMAMRVPANATATSSATKIWTTYYALPYGASLGKLGENWDRRDMTGDKTVKKYYFEQPITFTLPTDRMVELQFKVNLSSATATSWDDTTHRTEWAVGFQIDDNDLDHSCANFVSFGAWETHETSYITAVSAGTHTARLRTWLQNGGAPVFHYNPSTDNKDALWCGRRFIVWDRGPVV